MSGWLLALALSAVAQEASTSTYRTIGLEEAYRMALERSERVALDREQVAEAEQRAKELRGLVLPSLSASAQRSWQDRPSAGQSFRFNAFTTDARLTGTQTLFSGFREFLALKASERQTLARGSELQRARGLLYQDVVLAYVAVLGGQQDLATLRATRSLTVDRLEELRRRVRLGKSRESEVIAAEAQVAGLEADIERSEGVEDDAQELLRFLTGLEEDLRPEGGQTPALEPLEPFLARARSRPDVRAKELERQAQESLAGASVRERWPTVSASGNYFAHRQGALEGARWDARLEAQLPLFSGGAVSARIGQARSRASQAAIEAGLARRTAERETRAAHKALAAALSRLKKLERAAGLALANAKAQSEDYRLGLVTNLEVLSGLTALSQARLSRDEAALDAVAARARLIVAAGGPGQ